MIPQQQLDEEKEERRLVQQELERTTQRVAAMLDSMERVEKEFHTRGDSLIQLESSLQTSAHTIYALQVNGWITNCVPNWRLMISILFVINCIGTTGGAGRSLDGSALGVG